MSNPLIVQKSDDGGTGLSVVDGGIDLANDLTAESMDWVDVTIDGASEAIEIIGLVLDPLGGFFSAGVGWIIDHVSFLREPIDALLGDPDQITAVAATWQKIAESLLSTAQGIGDEVGSVSSWEGEAADHYRTSAQTLGAMTYGAMAGAAAMSALTTAAGVLTGSVRDAVYKAISGFVERVVIYIVTALASSWFTFGASIEVAIGVVEVDAETQAVYTETTIARAEFQVTVYTGKLGRICAKIVPILQKLQHWAEVMKDSHLGQAMEAIEKSHVKDAVGGAHDANQQAHGD